MKNIILTLIIIAAFISQGFSQHLPQGAPRIFPPPPNASALTKFSGVDVSLSTGMTQFNISLYKLSAGKLNCPISLSYSSNGVRVNEYPSLMGMSWILNAGGVITRTLYGAKDEGANRIPMPVPGTQAFLDYLLFYHDPLWGSSTDTEADVYSYNFLGYSGKFVLDENGIPVLLPHSNIKIETNFVNSSAYIFKITDAEGVQYFFGGNNATEETKANPSGSIQGGPTTTYIPTAYYLNKIVSPNGDIIYFDYDLYEHEIDPQDIVQINHTAGAKNGVCWGPDCPSCTYPCPPRTNFGRSNVLYKSRILSQIRVTNWATIVFSYTSYNIFFLSDLNGSYKLLTSILIKDENNVLKKSISLLYDYHTTNINGGGYTGCPVLTRRAFLKEVISGSDSYNFEYYSPDQLPVITSFSQDFWGFYNGKYNTTFISNFGNPIGYLEATADRNPDPAYAGYGLLKKITHPTGGSEAIEYEGNMMGTSIVGGMRVKKISARDAETATPIVKVIYYGPSNSLNSNSGISATPIFDKLTQNGNICLIQFLLTCEYWTRTSNTLNNLAIFNGGIIAYSAVTESIGGENFENGGIEHHYHISSNSYCEPIENGNMYQGPMNYSTILNGAETYTKVFKKSGSTEILLSETFNIYGVSPLYYKEVQSINIVARWIFIVGLSFEGFDVHKTLYRSSWEILDHSTTITYDENGLNPLTTTKSYNYDNIHHLQPRSVQTNDSKGNTLVSTLKYPEDFVNTSNPNIYDDMLSRNMIAIPLEKIDSRAVTQVLDSRVYYRNNQFPVPDHIETTVGNNQTYQELTYDTYDSKGNLLQFTGKDGTNSFIYDYNSFLPVAEIKNASQNNTAYTSFEADGKGNWNFTGTPQTGTTAVTGKKNYNLASGSITKSGLADETYIISYWTKNNTAFSIAGTMAGYPVQGRSFGDWKFFTHKITGQPTISISGNGVIDELRLYPEMALMNTMTYEPLIGITSQCNANNRITYYEYDSFNRLTLIRDQDNNIVKKICYNYAGQVENCESTCINTEPLWQNTNTPVRCQSVNTCGYTGNVEQEQIDINPCSLTLNDTRWVVVNYSPNFCTAVPAMFITYNVNSQAAGFTAEYTDYNGVAVFTEPIPTGSGMLLCLPDYTGYVLKITRPGNTTNFIFSDGCTTITGTSALFRRSAFNGNCINITIVPE